MKFTYFIFDVLIIWIAKLSWVGFSSITLLELLFDIKPITKAPILGLVKLLMSIEGVHIAFYVRLSKK